MSAPRPSEADVAKALCEHHSRARIVANGGIVEHRTPDESLPCGSCLAAARAVTPLLAAREAEHEREVASLRDERDDANEHAIECERIGSKAFEDRILVEFERDEARRALADRDAAIKAVLAGWDEAPSILSGADEWTKGWLRCLEQAATEIRALLPRDDAAGGA